MTAPSEPLNPFIPTLRTVHAVYRIGVIVRPKKTDALICQSLAKHFQLEIAQYGVPHADWFHWIIKRLRNAGLLALIGHLSLSLYIKLEQASERFLGKTIWEKYGVPTPGWTGLLKNTCHNEQDLKNQFKDVDLIIALDAFRLPQSFFRGLNTPFFEVAWGDATKFLGDSSAFWEYAMGKKKDSTVSIIKRTAYFQKISILTQIPVNNITDHETLRSLKVKQAIELSLRLPAVLDTALQNPHSIDYAVELKKIINQCYAPTLWTYVKFKYFGLDSLPWYACRPKDAILKMPIN